MKMLDSRDLQQILTQFDAPGELNMQSSERLDPDYILYYLQDAAGDKYGLLCRDYIQDDPALEEAVLSQERDITVLEWLNPENSTDYRLRLDIGDTFVYSFAMFRY